MGIAVGLGRGESPEIDSVSNGYLDLAISSPASFTNFKTSHLSSSPYPSHLISGGKLYTTLSS